MDDLFAYYRHDLGATNIAYKNDIAAEHAMPTTLTSATAAMVLAGNCRGGSTEL
jgi:hypothetical protein